MISFLTQIWGTIIAMAPYLLLGFGVSGILSVVVPSSFVEKHLGSNRLLSIIKATALGIPLPLCSCGVIPVAAGLKERGASKGATTAFLISTPQTGVDSIMVTYGLLGPIFTAFRVCAAIVCGIVSGLAISITDKTLDSKLKTNQNKVKDAEPCKLTIKEKMQQAITYGFSTLPKSIGKSLTIGILTAALVSTIIPDNFLTSIGGNSFLSMIGMLVFGIPLYVCATSSIPIAAALILKGISPGAALVFLMTGPATNAASIATINSMMGKKSTIIFLLSLTITSLGAGHLINVLAPTFKLTVPLACHLTQTSPIEYVAAIIFVFIILRAIYLSATSNQSSCCSTVKKARSCCGTNKKE